MLLLNYPFSDFALKCVEHIILGAITLVSFMLLFKLLLFLDNLRTKILARIAYQKYKKRLQRERGQDMDAPEKSNQSSIEDSCQPS